MENVYPPEIACFSAISSTDFDHLPTGQFIYGFFQPMPEYKQGFKWVALTDVFKTASTSKRTRGKTVPPGTLIYVSKPMPGDNEGLKQSVRQVMPIGIAVDGIQMPFTTASIQVSGIGCVKTGGAMISRFTNKTHEYSLTNSSSTLHRVATCAGSLSFEEAPHKLEQNHINAFANIIPSTGEILRKTHNVHRSWCRVSIERIRRWMPATATLPPFEHDESSPGNPFKVEDGKLNVNSNLVPQSEKAWFNTEN